MTVAPDLRGVSRANDMQGIREIVPSSCMTSVVLGSATALETDARVGGRHVGSADCYPSGISRHDIRFTGIMRWCVASARRHGLGERGDEKCTCTRSLGSARDG